MISKDLLDILCCPETKAVRGSEDCFFVSVSRETRRRYRIEDDIPIMLIDEAEQLNIEKWTEIMNRHGVKI